jgi:hypothetical protein
MPQITVNHQLDRPFTEEEIRATISELPAEKAPSPDGFTGVFYKTCCWIFYCVIKCSRIEVVRSLNLNLDQKD